MSIESALPFLAGILVGLVTGGLCALLYVASGDDESQEKKTIKICPSCRKETK